jgi:hypothetical protein
VHTRFIRRAPFLLIRYQAPLDVLYVLLYVLEQAVLQCPSEEIQLTDGGLDDLREWFCIYKK